MKQKKAEKRFPIFQDRLWQLRGKMSNTEFADFLGMSRQTIVFYLNGDRIPDILVLAQIAKKCNVSADWLIGLSPERAINGDLAQACRYIGLPADSTKKLHELSMAPTAHSKAPLWVVHGILSYRIDDFITWAWRAAMADCCIGETELASIRHNADMRLVEAAKTEDVGTAKTVEVSIADYAAICTSTAVGIIRESAEKSLGEFKDAFIAAYEEEKKKQ